MKALLQRVIEARVDVDGETVGRIDHGTLVLLGIEKHDDESLADKMIQRLLNYRIFSDADGKMNCSVCDVGGSILVVSQFTLAADTHKGLRPSFSSAAAPAMAQALYSYFVKQLSETAVPVASGRFAADMQVHLVNDGPVTFLLEM